MGPNALVYLDDTLHVFYMSPDKELVHAAVVDGNVVFQEVLGETEGPPAAVYDGSKLRVLAPHKGIYTRKNWGWAFIPWDIGHQADAWGNKVLCSDSVGVRLLTLSGDDGEVVSDSLIAHSWKHGNWYSGESETYTWPLALINGQPVYTTCHAWWHYDPYHDDYWYESWCSFWYDSSDNKGNYQKCAWDKAVAAISPTHDHILNYIVNGLSETSYLYPERVEIPWVVQPSLHYPYVLYLDTTRSTVSLMRKVSEKSWQVLWQKELPARGKQTALWALDDENFFALVQVESDALLLWGVGPRLGYRWRKGVLAIGGRGGIRFSFPDYPGARLYTEIYSADGRLRKAGLVKDGDRVPLSSGLYYVFVAGERLKAFVY